MSEQYGNIDDLLAGSKSPTQPETPEYQEPEFDDSPVEYDELPSIGDTINTDSEPMVQSEDEATPESEPEPEQDDYGNPKSKAKTYSEEELNDRINKAVRDRLARGSQQQQAQPTQQQVQQQAAGFEYNENAEGNWQQQLESFVENTVSRMSQKQAQQQQNLREQQVQMEFEQKFLNGIDKFSDFREIVGAQNISDPMTYALRGMKDPAAFIYAASKRQPQELQRIANINDPVTQVVEMGKLEERMRKAANGTSAPRPVSKTKEDSGLPHKPKAGELTIEQQIAHSDARKLAKMKARHSR